MTVLLRTAATLGLALGFAAAPFAQVHVAPDDADEPGRVIVDEPSSLGFQVVDDQDPLSIQAARAPARRTEAAHAEPTWETDAEAVPGAVFVPAARVDVGPLEDGRDRALVRGAPAVAVTGELADGRLATFVPSREVAIVYTGPLRDGRPDGVRGTPVVSDDAPAVVPFGRARVETASPARFVVLPNPASTEAWVELVPAAPSRATITVFDVRGREVLTAFDGPVAPGSPSRVRLDLSPLSAGAYVVTVEIDGARVSETIQVVR
ncbi:T9SS type A sorting domain-containing protein [Rubrivirga marina]|uniref:Secretion system C-terminal sorting domain-containing protein n=1 Tax=Rubrivirga marina TaxID=1196024 RepID=A0A271J1L4_9BACT|nr:T9SS type A sorting domain-containing protein [Rubrivirga marina]PAP76934.1 hypothetical protein BSZ37_11075 [Rubrivirga marina]